jgi:P-type conjugative transfer protein TrbJ
MKQLLLSLVGLLFTSNVAWAILGAADVVFDPTNLVQNAAAALSAAKSNINEATQLQQGIVSLTHQAKHLASLPQSWVNDITQAINGYYDILQQGRGLTYQVQSAAQQFEQLYEAAKAGDVQGGAQRLQAMLAQIREAGRVAVQAQAVFDRLCGQQAQIQQMVTASQSAVGTTQVGQATNQLLGALGEQQASLQQIAAATGRVQLSVAMRQTVAEEQARVNADAWLATWPQLGGFKGPGEGQGQRLPE